MDTFQWSQVNDDDGPHSPSASSQLLQNPPRLRLLLLYLGPGEVTCRGRVMAGRGSLVPAVLCARRSSSVLNETVLSPRDSCS